MSSINISLKKEAYNFLAELKAKNQSFSDVILSIKENQKYKKGSKEAILQFAGALKNKKINWDEREKAMAEFRKSFNKRVEETTKYMQEHKK